MATYLPPTFLPPAGLLTWCPLLGQTCASLYFYPGLPLGACELSFIFPNPCLILPAHTHPAAFLGFVGRAVPSQLCPSLLSRSSSLPQPSDLQELRAPGRHSHHHETGQEMTASDKGGGLKKGESRLQSNCLGDSSFLTL